MCSVIRYYINFFASLKYCLASSKLKIDSCLDTSTSLTRVSFDCFAIIVNSITNNTTGSFNTAMGFLSLDLNITGSSNVALGYAAGRSIKNSGGNNSNANDSVYIGAHTEAGAANVTEEIVIGFRVEGNGSNTTTIGDMVSTQATYLGGDLILQNASLHRGGYAVGALPTGVVGARAYVVNGPINAAYRDIVSSGSTGSEILPIFYNGTNWIYA